MIIRSIITAFSTYSIIPMPGIEWDRKNMRFSMCAFPLVGAVIGLALWGVHLAFISLSLPELVRAALLCLIPALISGGIHLDGYMDTCDALASHGDFEKKFSILKDPHIGAFAAICLAGLMLLEFALWASYPADRYEPLLVALIFIFSRCLSGLSVLCFKPSPYSSMALMFNEAEGGKVALVIQGFECIAVFSAFCTFGLRGALCAVTGVIVFLYYRWMSEKKFGGLNGDQAGWFLTVAEALMLVACVLSQTAT